MMSKDTSKSEQKITGSLLAKKFGEPVKFEMYNGGQWVSRRRRVDGHFIAAFEDNVITNIVFANETEQGLASEVPVKGVVIQTCDSKNEKIIEKTCYNNAIKYKLKNRRVILLPDETGVEIRFKTLDGSTEKRCEHSE